MLSSGSEGGKLGAHESVAGQNISIHITLTKEANKTIGNEEENCFSEVKEVHNYIARHRADIAIVTRFSVEYNKKVCRDVNELRRADYHGSEDKRDTKSDTVETGECMGLMHLRRN